MCIVSLLGGISLEGKKDREKSLRCPKFNHLTPKEFVFMYFCLSLSCLLFCSSFKNQVRLNPGAFDIYLSVGLQLYINVLLRGDLSQFRNEPP